MLFIYASRLCGESRGMGPTAHGLFARGEFSRRKDQGIILGSRGKHSGTRPNPDPTTARVKVSL